jgi:hypothetical protein
MKKVILPVLALALMTSSCATLFSGSSQPITFSGLEGTKIYDAATNMKLAEIGAGKTATVNIKKKVGDKQLLAKKDGYKNTPLILESSFNNTALLNIFFWPGFIVDYGTGKMNKWDNQFINIEMEKE